MHQAYFKNSQDIWDLFIKGLPFTKDNLPLLKTFYHLLKTNYQIVIKIKQDHTF